MLPGESSYRKAFFVFPSVFPTFFSATRPPFPFDFTSTIAPNLNGPNDPLTLIKVDRLFLNTYLRSYLIH